MLAFCLEAKSVKKSKPSVSNLQDELLKYWLHRDEKPARVLEQLGLCKESFSYSVNPLENVLENPLFHSWDKYLKSFNVKKPRDKTTILERLTRAFAMPTWRRCLERQS